MPPSAKFCKTALVALLDVEKFVFLHGGYFAWDLSGFRHVLRKSQPAFEAFALQEAERRMQGLRIVCQRLYHAGEALAGTVKIDLRPLAIFLTSFQLTRNYLEVGVVRDIQGRAADIVASKGGPEFQKAETIDERVESNYGITDLVLFELTDFIDKVPGAVLHVKNGGRFNKGDWRKFFKANVTRIITEAEAVEMDPAPFRRFFIDCDMDRLPQCLGALASLRNKLCEQRGLLPQSVQPVSGKAKNLAFDDPTDPDAPYWPAEEFQAKYGIPAGRLRQAKHRGHLTFKVPLKRPFYSVPGARRLWPADFEDAY